jgi:hypothetical protein
MIMVKQITIKTRIMTIIFKILALPIHLKIILTRRIILRQVYLLIVVLFVVTIMSGHCPAYGKKCRKCEQLNHFPDTKVCKSRYVNELVVLDSGTDEDDDAFVVHSAALTGADIAKAQPWCQSVAVEGFPISFKIDTGSDVNILPLGLYRRFGKKNRIVHTKKKLIAFGLLGDQQLFQ